MTRVRRYAIHWRNKAKKSTTGMIRSHDRQGTHDNKSHDARSHDINSKSQGSNRPVVAPCGSQWDKIIECVELPRLSRPPPRRPNFLYNDDSTPVSTTGSIVESMPLPPVAIPPTIPSDYSAIVKPNDWKLLPPSAFTKPIIK